MIHKMDKALSGKNVLKLCGNKSNILIYSNLVNYNKVEDILKYNACIILYETKENFGHWTCITRRNNIISFFDSYGLRPDYELKWIRSDFRKNNDESYPKLTSLLLDASKRGYIVEYNEYQYQKFNKDISTCGRWTGIRVLCKDFTNEEFLKLIKGFKIDPDKLILYLSSIIK